ncbi:hypothetical protein WH47_01446 [Habropoda laboriosa]|uniref:Uncharacterized protein n=1 Tax=Habropoda laboriosa TaxID=597456 RepID=A0A0L7R5E9_9HYME|nr:hypothetical protein WH47_01446 [Habropoda laboriosa]
MFISYALSAQTFGISALYNTSFVQHTASGFCFEWFEKLAQPLATATQLTSSLPSEMARTLVKDAKESSEGRKADRPSETNRSAGPSSVYCVDCGDNCDFLRNADVTRLQQADSWGSLNRTGRIREILSLVQSSMSREYSIDPEVFELIERWYGVMAEESDPKRDWPKRDLIAYVPLCGLTTLQSHLRVPERCMACKNIELLRP